MQPIIISILGKPNSGKDTIAAKLASNLPDAVCISPGEIIREVRRNPEHRFHPILEPYLPDMEAGIQLPDVVMNSLFAVIIPEYITEGKTTIILAGSPRTGDQLAVLRDIGTRFAAFYIDVTDEETYRRSATRGEGRVDDNPLAHKKRLDAFDENIKPVLMQLMNEGNLIAIDGMQPKEVVFANVEKKLRNFVEPEIHLPNMARR